MGILIDCVRIANFRAIKNIEVNLSLLTMLVGANNAGKTSFLRALHLALGFDRRVVLREDVHDDGKNDPDNTEIIIDVRIIPINEDGTRMKEFDQIWNESDGFSGNIKTDQNDYEYLAIRTKYKFDLLSQTYKADTKILKEWLPFRNWIDVSNEETGRLQKIETIPLIFVDAQRDIQLDLKDRTSFLGKLTNKPNIDSSIIEALEQQINSLNEDIINGSSNLQNLREKLQELNKTVNISGGTGVEILPVNKKIRDIGRNLNINFKDSSGPSFPLEYHGMGTRSWASLLTLNAFISWQEETNNPYFPVLALEEPEAHLHPNAQRQLYHQLANIKGQKIISTHSPFVAAQCDLMDLRHFYKDKDGLKVGQLEFSEGEEEQIRLLKQQIIDGGNTGEIKRELCPKISELIKRKANKLDKEEKRKIERTVLNNRGELLFSKIIILFEGETEEQALPIFSKEKFGIHPFELGISFVGVGGKANYSPFLNFAKFLNIKWHILSDGDGNTEGEVKNQIKKVFDSTYWNKLFIFEGLDFEDYLVEKGYTEEINKAINCIENCNDFIDQYIQKHNLHPLGKDENGVDILRNYLNEIDGGKKRALRDIMHGDKTKYAAVIAQEICKKKDANGKTILPPKIDELFNKIALDFNIELP